MKRLSRLLAVLLFAASFAGFGQTVPCRPIVFEGDVHRGEAFRHALTPALEWKLEAVPAGWMIRVLPRGVPRPPHDAAELANPPYQSPTPILISTDFAFRAQDAVGWNPRSFRFYTSATQISAGEAAMQGLQKEASRAAATPVPQQHLPDAPAGQFRILDAELAGGTADQAAGAATVAVHFADTAHRVRADLLPTPLGTLLMLRFRVTIQPRNVIPGCR